MAGIADLRKRWAWITGLRAVLMLIGGLYAVISPVAALAVLVVVGGALLLIDGVLGLWSLTFGGAKTGNFWFDVVRNALAIIVGVLILVSPLIATVLTTTILIYLIAFQAIIVGVMEIVVVTRERGLYSKIWPVLLSGILYVLFGLALLFAPLMSAAILVMIVGVLAIIFSIGLFGLAWRQYRNAGEGD
jgi:uncharacterized membrane protein HdeD (DUF308 family)